MQTSLSRTSANSCQRVNWTLRVCIFLVTCQRNVKTVWVIGSAALVIPARRVRHNITRNQHVLFCECQMFLFLLFRIQIPFTILLPFKCNAFGVSIFITMEFANSDRGIVTSKSLTMQTEICIMFRMSLHLFFTSLMYAIVDIIESLTGNTFHDIFIYNDLIRVDGYDLVKYTLL